MLFILREYIYVFVFLLKNKGRFLCFWFIIIVISLNQVIFYTVCFTVCLCSQTIIMMTTTTTRKQRIFRFRIQKKRKTYRKRNDSLLFPHASFFAWKIFIIIYYLEFASKCVQCEMIWKTRENKFRFQNLFPTFFQLRIFMCVFLAAG